MQQKFYHKNFEKIDFQEIQNSKKTKFLAFRLEPNKFLQLKEEAQELEIDLSELIRRKLENV